MLPEEYKLHPELLNDVFDDEFISQFDLTNQIDLVRIFTQYELYKILNKDGGCCNIIRPTGFGKTWLVTDIITSRKFGNVVYIYPTNVIRDTVSNKIINDTDAYETLGIDAETEELIETLKDIQNAYNLTTMSYHKFARLNNDEVETLIHSNDLIIFDESHRIGSKKTKQNAMHLATYIKNNKLPTKYIGCTATPIRSDGFDVTSMIFDNVKLFDYNLHNAITDGLLQAPYYYYQTSSIKATIYEKLDALDPTKQLLTEEDIEIIASKAQFKAAKIHNVDKTLKEAIDLRNKDFPNAINDYYKFIVFFSDIEELMRREEEVTDLVKKVFPTFNIRTLIIHSKHKQFRNNLNKLDTLTYTPNTFDLILCVDMLNMGYHMDDNTGVITYRTTYSNIIYNQQIGRAFSSGASIPAIIIDVPDNLHRPALFTRREADENDDDTINFTTENTIKYKVDIDSMKVYNYVTNDEESTIHVEIDKTTNSFILVNENNEKLDMKIAKTTNDSLYFKPNINLNQEIKNLSLKYTDIYGEGHLASYDEFIGKAVSEGIKIRLRRCLFAHLATYLRMYSYENDDLPFDDIDEKILSLWDAKVFYDFDVADFKKWFIDFVAKYGYGYPYDDLDALEGRNTKLKYAQPLSVYATAYNIDVKDIAKIIIGDDPTPSHIPAH